MNGYLVLESGKTFSGQWCGGEDRAGEVVFNTSHSGYEEISTDPSYFSQIIVMSATQQGNYGVDDAVWESKNIWIQGFICLEAQASKRDKAWIDRLSKAGVPIVDQMDTRSLVLHLREQSTPWGALIQAETKEQAIAKAFELIKSKKQQDQDWVHQVTCDEAYEVAGAIAGGARVAILDFGMKLNILRELQARCEIVKVFPARTSATEIIDWRPHGVMLSNGPGDPELVEVAVDTIKKLLGQKFIFGICMGHQLLSLALGAKTFKLKFGHRGSNQPVKDKVLNMVYVTSQNHGYAVDENSIPKGVEVSHVHLNDKTVSGIQCLEQKCMSVQFHPESHPGPRDSEGLFDYFIKQIQ